MYRLILAFALSLATAQVAAETMYQWTDDRGGTQFGQQPPADRPFQKVDIRAAPNLGSPVRSQPPAPVEPAAAARQANCDKLRENLKTLSDNPRLSRRNEAGEVERIGEDERQSMIAEAKQNLATYCVNN
jgi:hypothetical protein